MKLEHQMKKRLTVGGLIKKLQQYPEDTEIKMLGSDYYEEEETFWGYGAKMCMKNDAGKTGVSRTDRLFIQGGYWNENYKPVT